MPRYGGTWNIKRGLMKDRLLKMFCTITALALICLLTFACSKKECVQFEEYKQGMSFSTGSPLPDVSMSGLVISQEYANILRWCLEYPYTVEIVLLKESPFSDKDTSFIRIYPTYESIFDTSFNKPIQFGKTTINFILIEPGE